MKIKCVMNLSSFWLCTVVLYHMTALQPWLHNATPNNAAYNPRLTPNTSYYMFWMVVLTPHANGLITENKHFKEWFINSHRTGFTMAFSHIHCFYFSSSPHPFPGLKSPARPLIPDSLHSAFMSHIFHDPLSFPSPIKITSSLLMAPFPVSSHTHFDLTSQAQLHPCPYICIYSWRNPLCMQTPFSSPTHLRTST